MPANLNNIYRIVEDDIARVNGVLKDRLKTRYPQLCLINDYLLSWGGKRLRPALVFFSAYALAPARLKPRQTKMLVSLAAAVELIHTASLIHDDIIDNSTMRRNKPTIHMRWGKEVAVAFGDYIYSQAFELVSVCSRSDVLDCIAGATRAMCEGQLLQVLERDNFNLAKEKYILIVKKKTACLMSACCRAAGLIISHKDKKRYSALDNYGLNFGIAFQIVDDYLDIMGEDGLLGKTAGQDIGRGELTLPLYDLFSSLGKSGMRQLKQILVKGNIGSRVTGMIKRNIISKKVFLKTKQKARLYVYRSKRNLSYLKPSRYRDGLMELADYIIESGFNNSTATLLTS